MVTIRQRSKIRVSLETPVSRSIKSLQKPQMLLARVEHAMSGKLGADPAYNHRLTKTPSHEKWRTFYGRKNAYSLDELREYLPNNLPLIKKRSEAVGEGRNVLIFTDLRNWAYRARLSYASFELWNRACYMKAKEFNSQIRAPLPLSEIKATAKSVAGWVWKNFSHDKFSTIQGRRGVKSGLVRQEKNMDLACNILRDII